MKKFKILYIFFLVVVMLTGCASNSESKKKASKSAYGEKIKVLLFDGKKKITLEGVKNFGSAEIVYKSKTTALLNRVDKPVPLKLYPKDKFITINGQPYRGAIIILPAKKVGTYMIINELYLENYLAGLINAEMNSKWHMEAIKSQAVIARTYALYQKKSRINDPYHLKNSHMDQVYHGAGKEDDRAFSAVNSTKGIVVTYKGDYALTLYHGNGGGKTENVENVWGGKNSSKNMPYLSSRKSPWDKGAPNYAWEFSVPIDKFASMLKSKGYSVNRIKSVKIKKKTRTGRVLTVLIKTKGKDKLITLTGEELRAALGYAKLRSTMFKAKKSGKSVLFSGFGSGHGVGLSQWGAKGMAEKGYNYKKILKHYYRGAKLVKKY